MSGRVYLDNAATTAVDPEVVREMAACLGPDGVYANPSSSHGPGTAARRLVERARERIAERVGADPGEIVFTSGATESNNLALKGVVAAQSAPHPHLVTTRIEHRSVLDPASALARGGAGVSHVDCDSEGLVAVERLVEAMTPRTVLASVIHVNNEIGVVQDIAAIAAACRHRGVLVHVDAAQSVGKLPVDLRAWGVDLCSLTAHKLHGPKGIGALYVRRGLVLEPLLHGGAQERGLRAGTLATHQIAGMGKAYELADPGLEAPRLRDLRDRLWAGLAQVPDARRNGSAAHAAPHILNVSFPGVDGESLRFALRDLAVSGGSACASNTPDPSYVLTGLGLGDALAQSALRLSVSRFTSPEQVDFAVERVRCEVARLRALAGPAPAWCSS